MNWKYITLVMTMLLFGGCVPENKQDQVCFGPECFNVEVARNRTDRIKGLQHRIKLGENEGMLFLFPYSSRHRFWMKDTKLPLDIIWLDHARRVVHIAPQAMPCQSDPCPHYTPERPASYVLEINAGLAGRFGITYNSQAEFKIHDTTVEE